MTTAEDIHTIQRNTQHTKTTVRVHSRKLERAGIQMKRGPIALAYVKRHILRIETLDHGSRCLVHEFLSET